MLTRVLALLIPAWLLLTVSHADAQAFKPRGKNSKAAFAKRAPVTAAPTPAKPRTTSAAPASPTPPAIRRTAAAPTPAKKAVRAKPRVDDDVQITDDDDDDDDDVAITDD